MDNSAQQKNQPQQIGVGSMAKEQMGGVGVKEVVQSVSSEVVPPTEVVDVGVKVRTENVEIPPDLQKMGVAPSGPAVPVTTTVTPQSVVLPISDQQIEVGLHMQVYSALRWLAEWCLRKLKKAHLTLKVIHGKIMRVQYK